MNKEFKKTYDNVFSLISRNGLFEYKYDKENRHNYLTVQEYEQTVNNSVTDVTVKLRKIFDSGIRQDIRECKFFMENEEMFEVRVVEENRRDTYLRASIYVQGKYVEKDQQEKLLKAIGAEKIFKIMEDEQSVKLGIKNQKENIEEERKAQKQAFLVDSILDKIKSLSKFSSSSPEDKNNKTNKFQR